MTSHHHAQQTTPPHRRRVYVAADERNDPINEDMLVSALVLMVHRFTAQDQFMQWLASQDPRITISRDQNKPSGTAMAGQTIFAFFDTGRLVCRLPDDERHAAMTLPHARRWTPPHDDHRHEEWVQLPENADRPTQERYALAAAHHALR